MKSLNEIKKIAKELINLSLDDQGHITEQKVIDLTDIILSGHFPEVPSTQIVTLIKEFKKLLAQSITEDTIQVITSIELTDSEKREKTEKLKKQFKKSNVIFEVDPEIIAGTRIQAGWDIQEITLKKSLDTLTS